jgi:protein-tyrosine phosphatase
MDDGPEDFETALAMVRMAAEAGTTDIVATPHSDLRFKFDAAIVARRVSELQNAVGTGIRIHVGCDFRLHFENVVGALENPAKYTINGGPYLLLEFSERIPPNTTDLLQRLRDRGIVPVITHPERNRELRAHPKRLRGWTESGCTLQITGQSFTGLFGDSASRSAHELVRERPGALRGQRWT